MTAFNKPKPNLLLDFVFPIAQAGRRDNVRHWQIIDSSPNDSGLWMLHTCDNQAPASAPIDALECLTLYARANLYQCRPSSICGNWHLLWHTHPTDGFTMLASLSKTRVQVVGAYRQMRQYSNIENGKAWAVVGECRIKDETVLHTVSKFGAITSVWGDTARRHWAVLEKLYPSG